jgi:hypothetical protein
MVIGRLIERAAEQLKNELIKTTGGVPKDRAGLKRAARLVCGAEAVRRFEVQYEKPADITWDDSLYRGEAYGVFSYAAVAGDLEVDRHTNEG